MIAFFKKLFSKSEDYLKVLELQNEITCLKRIVQDLEIENSDFEICKVNLLEENRELKNQIKELKVKIDSVKIIFESIKN